MYFKPKLVNKYYSSYERKAKVLELGIDKEERDFKKRIAEHPLEGRHILENEYVKRLNDDPLWQEAQRVNNASYAKRKRLNNRIEKFLTTGKCIFLTLTFRDDVLKSTSEETRRRYVTRFLKECSFKYVANIDYGKTNEREHYHAVVQCEQVDNKKWLYGAINFERVKQSSDSIKLAKYVVKLTNHAMKKTVQKNKTIYSRNI